MVDEINKIKAYGCAECTYSLLLTDGGCPFSEYMGNSCAARTIRTYIPVSHDIPAYSDLRRVVLARMVG
jgi:hypothetical protein